MMAMLPFITPSAENLKEVEELLKGYKELVGKPILTPLAQNHQNVYFCYEKDTTVVMDNHRCALWHWVDKIDPKKEYNIIHLDSHYDLDRLKLNSSISKKELEGLSFLDYLNYKDHEEDEYFFFNWANYIQPFLNLYPENTAKLFLMINEKPDGVVAGGIDSIERAVDIEGYDALDALRKMFDEYENWIINFDIDYFFKYNMQLYSDEYIEAVLDELKKFTSLESSLLTIALSPACCGGWENAIKILEKMQKKGLLS